MDKNLTFWINMISPHIMPVIKRVSELHTGKVSVVVPSRTLKVRDNIGWEGEGDYDFISIIEAPDDETITDLLKDVNTIHLFGGIWAFKLGWKVIRRAVALQLPVGVISEAPDLRGVKGWGRKILALGIEVPLRKKVIAFFGIGEQARIWYKKWGVSPSSIFPFRYVSEVQHADVETNPTPVQLVYAGKLTQLKNVIGLLRALAPIERDYMLHIYGDGPERQSLEDFMSKNKLVNKVRIHGFVKHQLILSKLYKYDYLILPSHYDGWGAVVNEGLHSGLKVLVSNECGSSELVKNRPALGASFAAKDEAKLRILLQQAIAHKPNLAEKKYIRQWAADNISADAIAKEFLKNLTIAFSDKPQTSDAIN